MVVSGQIERVMEGQAAGDVPGVCARARGGPLAAVVEASVWGKGYLVMIPVGARDSQGNPGH